MSDAHKDPMHGRVGDGLVQIQRHADRSDDPIKRLSEELDGLLTHATERDFDAGKLDLILSALDDADPVSDAEAFDAERGLRRFHERLAVRNVDKDDSAARSFKTSLSQRPKRNARKIALIAAVLIVVLATTAQAFHWDLFGLVARWTSEILHLGTETVEYAQIAQNPLAKDEERAYDSVQDMLDDFGVTAPLVPAWVPERFGEPSISAANLWTGLSLYMAYQTQEGFLIFQAVEIQPKGVLDVERDSSDMQMSHINGRNYYFFSDVNAEKAVWQNGAFECRVSGSVTREEMKQIVSSINGE